MTTIELFFAGKWTREVPFPTHWDELSLTEMALFGDALANNGSKPELFLNMIAERARTNRVKLPAYWRVMLDPEDGAREGLPLIEQLLEENNRTVNPTPVLRSLYGPADAFNDLTVGEWEEAEIAFAQYCITRDLKYLAEIGAMLWRPVSNGEREPFAGYKVNPKSFFGRVGAPSLHIIYLWYAGCRSHLVSLFPDVFNGGATKSSPDAAPDLSAITRLIHGGAGPKNGTREQVRATLVKEFLFDCQLAAEQAADQEAEIKRMQR